MCSALRASLSLAAHACGAAPATRPAPIPSCAPSKTCRSRRAQAGEAGWGAAKRTSPVAPPTATLLRSLAAASSRDAPRRKRRFDGAPGPIDLEAGRAPRCDACERLRDGERDCEEEKEREGRDAALSARAHTAPHSMLARVAPQWARAHIVLASGSPRRSEILKLMVHACERGAAGGVSAPERLF
jgi:hypothetical protein